MVVNKCLGKVIGGTLTNAEQKALEIEMRRQIHEQERQYCNDMDALLLYVVHTHFHKGKKGLRNFYDDYYKELTKLTEYYEMPKEEVYLARLKLQEIGVDVEAWNREKKGARENEHRIFSTEAKLYER